MQQLYSNTQFCSTYIGVFSSSQTVNMTVSSKTKLFSFIKKIYQNINNSSSRPNPHSSPINSNKRIFLFSIAQLLIPSIAYVLFEANSMFEYGLAIYSCITTIVFSLFWRHMDNIYDYIENCERFIEQSEYDSISNSFNLTTKCC